MGNEVLDRPSRTHILDDELGIELKALGDRYQTVGMRRSSTHQTSRWCARSLATLEHVRVLGLAFEGLMLPPLWSEGAFSIKVHCAALAAADVPR